MTRLILAVATECMTSLKHTKARPLHTLLLLVDAFKAKYWISNICRLCIKFIQLVTGNRSSACVLWSTSFAKRQMEISLKQSPTIGPGTIHFRRLPARDFLGLSSMPYSDISSLHRWIRHEINGIIYSLLLHVKRFNGIIYSLLLHVKRFCLAIRSSSSRGKHLAGNIC
jgi:hypothetical protein